VWRIVFQAFFFGKTRVSNEMCEISESCEISEDCELREMCELCCASQEHKEGIQTPRELHGIADYVNLKRLSTSYAYLCSVHMRY
jgi:hypothetical protein